MTKDTSEQLPYSAILQVLLGAIFLSFAPVLVRLSQMPSTVVGFYRVSIGGLALLLIAMVAKQRVWYGLTAASFAILGGLFFSGDLFFFQIGIHYIGPGLATILGNCQVFLLAIFGMLFLKESTSWLRLAAFPLVAIGLLMLVGLKWHVVGQRYHLGIYCGIATAICYGCYVLVLRQAQQHQQSLNPLGFMVLICISASLMLATIGKLQGETFSIPNNANLIYMLCYGIFCQAVAWYLIARSITKIPVTVAGLVLLTQPALAFIWDVLIFHRPTPAVEWYGAIITLLAIFLGLQSKTKINKNATTQN